MNLTLTLSCFIFVMWLLCERCKAAPRLINGIHRNPSYPHLHGYAIEDLRQDLIQDLMEDLVGEDEEELRLNKLQKLDDYNHMRFGKRSDNDVDYEFSRFGRDIN